MEPEDLARTVINAILLGAILLWVFSVTYLIWWLMGAL